MISDNNEKTLFGLLEIKCPISKKKLTPLEIVEDPKFYVGFSEGQPFLKESHKYYTQVQMAMGLSQADFCDFVVYTFKGMIIIRVPFDLERFKNIVDKLSTFYKKFLLPSHLKKQ